MPSDAREPWNDIPPTLDRMAAARWLGISLRKLDDLVSRGEVPSVKLGRRRVFYLDRLRRWLEQKHEEAGAV